MRKSVLCWLCVFISLALPVLACGSLAGRQVTPTPTKTPRRIKLLPESPVATPTLALLPTITATPEVPVDTPTPVPPPDTPAPELPPTDTATPEPTPTDVPPPPPPTNTPPPPPPTNTPAPPPPTAPPVNQGPDVVVELPDGSTFDTGEKVKMVFIVRDPDGVSSFTWGIFTQNETPLMGGEKKCNGAVECREEKKVDAPVSGTYIVGADAIDVKGNTSRGIGEIYVR